MNVWQNVMLGEGAIMAGLMNVWQNVMLGGAVSCQGDSKN